LSQENIRLSQEIKRCGKIKDFAGRFTLLANLLTRVSYRGAFAHKNNKIAVEGYPDPVAPMSCSLRFVTVAKFGLQKSVEINHESYFIAFLTFPLA
jgi:hypothetical protein